MKTAFAPKFLQFLLLPLFVFMLNVGWGQTTIATQDFESSPATPTWGFTSSFTGGTFSTASSYTTAAGERPPSTAMFLGSRSVRFTGPSTGTQTATITFDAIDTRNYTSISTSFRIASFATSNTQGWDATNDFVRIEVSPDNGTTWYQQAQATAVFGSGGGNATWAFSGTGSGSRAYAANNTLNTYSSGSVTGGTTSPVTYTGSNAITTITITGLPSVQNLRMRFILSLNGSTSENTAIDNVTLTGTATPTISTSGTLSAVSTTYGTASESPTSFTVTGSALNGTTAVTVTPPAGFEVATSSDFSTTIGTSASALSLGTATSIASTTIYVRLAATASVSGSPYSGNIVVAGGGATSQNVATVSSTVSKKALTITAGNQSVAFGTAVATVTGNGSYTPTGFVNSETSSVIGGSASYTTTYTTSTASGSNVAAITPATTSLTAENYSFTAVNGNISVTAVTPSAPTITSITSGDTQLSVAFSAPSSNGGASITNYEYSTNGGFSWTTPSAAITSSPFTISGLINGTTYDVQIRAVNSAGSGAASATVQGTPAAPSSPTISGAATASAFTTTYGTASAPQSFSISGSVLTADITATAPTGFEVSSDGTTYGSTATFTQSSGNASGTLYIRLAATAGVSGSYNSQNIVLSSTGASSINITTSSSGNTVSQKALAITAATIASKVYNRSTTSGTVTPGTLSGFVGSETVVVSSAIGSFADWNVGTGKTATISYTLGNGSNGGLATNYTLANTIATGDITAKALTVTTPAVTTKTYDGNTNASITGTLSVVESGDVVTLSGTGTFASANVGTGSVTSTSTLGGVDEGNYSLTQPTGLTGEITLKSLTITATDVSKEMGVLLTGGAGSTAFTSTGLAGSETIGSVTITYGAAGGTTGQGATAGIYSGQVTPSAATGGTFNAANYSITYSSGSITVSGFTPGNIVVNRIGNGSTTLTNAASSINVLELNTSGITQQTISTLFTGSNLLTETGTGTSNGNLNSYNTLLGVSGYNSALGTTSVTSSNTKATNILGTGATVVNRVVFPTSGSPLPFTANNFRSIIPTSATTFYASGSGGSSTGGIWYYDGSAFTQVSSTSTGQPTNCRNVEVYNSQLYFSSSTGTYLGISKLGTGLPTSSNQTAVLEINMGTGASPYGFVLSPDGNTMYVADDRPSASGGIYKFTKSGGTWSQAYLLGTGVSSIGARGLTVDFSGSDPIIYATTAEDSANRIIKITDTGSVSSSTTLATAASNYVFRGVDFSPAAAPSAPTIGTVTQTTCSTSTGSVELTGLPSGQWRIYGFPSGSAVGTGSSATISGLGAGSYTFLVTSYTGRTSEVSASVTINAQPSTPSAPTSPVNASRCGSGTVLLSATVPAGITIDWYSAATGGTLLLSGNSSYTTASISSTTTYYAEARNTTSGCVSSSRTQVTATVNPTPAITAMTTSLCSGSSFSVTPANETNGTVPSGTIYTWAAPTTASIQGLLAGSAASSISGTLFNTTNTAINAVYTVTPTAESCAGTPFTVTVTVNALPYVLVTADNATVCAGNSASLTAAMYSALGPNVAINTPSYVWSNAATTAVASVSPSTTTYYTVIGTNTATGCSNTGGVLVTVNAAPTALTITGTNCLPTSSSPGTVSSASSVSGVSYQLTHPQSGDVGNPITGTGSGLLWTDVPAVPTAQGFYTIVATNALGCSASSNGVYVWSSAGSTPYSYYADADGDTYSSTIATSFCQSTAPSGYSVTSGGDCNDSNPSINPGISEVCGDGIDNDCSGSDAYASFYRSYASGDWSSASTWQSSCDNGVNYVAASLAPTGDNYSTASPYLITVQSPHTVTVSTTSTTNCGKAGSLTINFGGTVIVNGKLTVVNAFVNSGTLTINNGGSFVQNSTTTANSGNGTFNVNMTLSGSSNAAGTAANGRYWFIGSPMNNTVAGTFYDVQGLARLWRYNGSNNSWPSVVSTTLSSNNDLKLVPGIGYLFRAGVSTSFTFTGGTSNFNNNITTSLLPASAAAGYLPVNGYSSSTGFKFVSNPYPSHVDWHLVTRTGLNVSYWIRTADNTNYESYNLSSGLSTNNISGQTTRFIPPMQGFYVYAFNTTPTLRIDNTDRVHSGNVLHTPEFNQVVRLNLNDGKTTDETVVYENENASNGLEDYDTYKMFDTQHHQLYIMEGIKELSMDGLKDATAKQKVDMGIQITGAGTYTINATELGVEEDVMLEDKFTHTFQDMKRNSAYTFESNAGTYNNRFVLHFTLTPSTETAIETETVTVGETVGESEGVQVYTTTGQQVKVWVTNTAEFQNATVKVYDAIGNMIERKNMTSNELLLDLDTATGVYLVEVTGANKTFTKKVFITK